MSMMRFCPNCQTERPLNEIFCEGQVAHHLCGWDLSREPIRQIGWRPTVVVTADMVANSTVATDLVTTDLVVTEMVTTDQFDGQNRSATTYYCQNNHQMGDGDLLCLECGAEMVDNCLSVAPTISSTDIIDFALSATQINDWRLLSQTTESELVYRRYDVEHCHSHQQGTLTLYHAGCEPDLSIYQLLKTFPREHVPEILEIGRWQGQAFLVSESLQQGSLADMGYVITDSVAIKHAVTELGQALNCFVEAGLRLCDLRPETLLVRNHHPLDLVVTDFGSARLSEFDLDIISPLKPSFYMAPETIAGGVSVSSDWWSLGMILLEQITQGGCFKNINPQAFMIHILTNGVIIPDHIDADIHLLLRGLLAKNHHQRWQWQQVNAWLNGEQLVAPDARSLEQDNQDGVSIELNQRSYRKPTLFALAAAESTGWLAASELLANGTLLTWLTQINHDLNAISCIRTIVQCDTIPPSFKLMLTLKVLNNEIPLVLHGEIVSSAWLIQHPIEGYQLISSVVTQFLKQLETESWLWRLHQRIEKVNKRAESLELVLDHEMAKIHLLSTSRANLLSQWQERWLLFPDASHAGLLSLMERTIISDEDLIILLSAPIGLFKSVARVIDEVKKQVGEFDIITFDVDLLPSMIIQPRSVLYKQLNETIVGFAKTGYEVLNQWVEQYRLEKRLPLTRLLLLLGIDKSQWLQPEQHQYTSQIIDYFSKKVITSVMQGPMVRMKVGQSRTRVDIFTLGTETKSARQIVNHLLARTA